VCSDILGIGEGDGRKMATMFEVLKAVQPNFEKLDKMNKKEWNAICAMRVTTSRRQASHFWEVLCTMKVLVPINGTTWMINHDNFYTLVSECNPGTNDPITADGGA